MEYDAELETALEAARRAGQTIRQAYASFEAIADPRIDISTAADRAAQEVILQYLHQAHPHDALCAEEQTSTLAASPPSAARAWIVDPIDGTRGFAKKNGQFSTMIALVDGQRLALGLVLEPIQDRLSYAVLGRGCWARVGSGPPERCRVTSVAELASATLVQSHSKAPTGPVKALRPRQVLETYSAGVKLALVARGEVDLYVNTYTEFHDWDIAAGHLLVTEAGGTVTGLRGEPIRYRTEGAWQRQGLLASNGALHTAAVTALKSATL